MNQPRPPADQPANDGMSRPTPVPNRRWRVLRIAGAVVFALVVAAEVALRSLGVVDFPVYDADPMIGYIQKPGQSGAFLNRNRWVINEKSQFGPPWNPTARPNLLLIGDSLVWGGNPYKYQERLGPMMQTALPNYNVWPVGAGSWAARNEMEYMRRNPDVTQYLDVIVWIFNTGDFAERSQWSSEAMHPRRRPPCAIWYVLDKYAIAKLRPPKVESATIRIDPEVIGAIRAQLQTMAETGRLKKTWIILYPDRNEFHQRMQTPLFREAFEALKSIASDTLVVVNGGEVPGWREEFYRDAIHPTEEGKGHLAKFLGQQILR